MALPKFKKLEDVPEAFRAEYMQEGDEWVPKPPDLGDAGVAAVQKERDLKKAEKKRADDAEAALAEMKRTQEAKDRGISEEELQKIRDAEALARKPIEDELATTKAENRKLKLTDKVQALYLANGGMPDRVEDAMLALEKRTDLGDAGGIVFLGKDGKATAEDAAAFFKAFKIEKPWLFAGSGGSGSGAGGSGGGGGDEKTVTPESVRDAKRRQVSGAF